MLRISANAIAIGIGYSALKVMKSHMTDLFLHNQQSV
jgi:hypothetical protein